MKTRLLLAALLCGPLLSSPAIAQNRDLISGNIFEHFRPTKLWSAAGSVRAIEGKSEFEIRDPEKNTILYNGLKKHKAPYLFTKDEFGDVAVYLEFMIPKGSNAGVYLMGRYEIQIFDSFGVDHVKSTDLGGIYKGWRKMKHPPESPYPGSAPMTNAALPPGEWQTMLIRFRAPRFDSSGKKTQNATFLSVRINGKLVQQNAEVTEPTVSAQFPKDEADKGPLVIQGDHGPVAIRTLKIKPL